MKKILVIILLLGLICFTTGVAFAEGNTPVTVACVGDSITYGEVPYSGGGFNLIDYPSVLGNLLGDDWAVYNFGRPGASLTLPGLWYPVCRENYAAIDLCADYYFVMLGSNDSAQGDFWDPEAYEKNLVELVEKYEEANPNTVIFLMSPPFTKPHQGTDYYSLNPELLKNDIHDIVQRVADELNTEFLDIYSVTSENQDWVGADGVHFSQEGYEALGNYVYEQLNNYAKAG